jgi:hypothetical protein
MPPFMAAAKKDPNLHKTFEDTFCKAIKESDPKSFVEAECAIDFTYSFADNLGWGRHGKNADYTGVMQGQFQLGHIIHDSGAFNNSLTDSMDMTIIAKCFKDMYNEVHADTPYSINSFTLDRIVEVPDNDLAGTGTSDKLTYGHPYWSYNWYHFGWGCRFCPADDKKFIPPIMEREMLTVGRHAAFEGLFTQCLKNSGIPAYQAVKDAKIVFGYNTMEEAPVPAMITSAN